MKTSIASLFGFKQREMAMALGLSLSTWSMYECGKRKLPLRAQELLNDMLLHLNASKGIAKKTADSETESRIARVKFLLEENALRQQALLKKIAAQEKKQAAARQYKQFEAFVEKHNAAQKKRDQTPMFVPTHTKRREAEANDNDLMFEYRLRQELLVQEQNLLESRLSELSNRGQKK